MPAPIRGMASGSGARAGRSSQSCLSRRTRMMMKGLPNSSKARDMVPPQPIGRPASPAIQFLDDQSSRRGWLARRPRARDLLTPQCAPECCSCQLPTPERHETHAAVAADCQRPVATPWQLGTTQIALRTDQQATHRAPEAAPLNPLLGELSQVGRACVGCSTARCAWGEERRPCPSAGQAARKTNPAARRARPRICSQPFRNSRQQCVCAARLPTGWVPAPRTHPCRCHSPAQLPQSRVQALPAPWIATRECPCRGRRRSTRRTRCAGQRSQGRRRWRRRGGCCSSLQLLRTRHMGADSPEAQRSAVIFSGASACLPSELRCCPAAAQVRITSQGKSRSYISYGTRCAVLPCFIFGAGHMLVLDQRTVVQLHMLLPCCRRAAAVCWTRALGQAIRHGCSCCSHARAVLEAVSAASAPALALSCPAAAASLPAAAC